MCIDEKIDSYCHRIGGRIKKKIESLIKNARDESYALSVVENKVDIERQKLFFDIAVVDRYIVEKYIHNNKLYRDRPAGRTYSEFHSDIMASYCYDLQFHFKDENTGEPSDQRSHELLDRAEACFNEKYFIKVIFRYKMLEMLKEDFGIFQSDSADKDSSNKKIEWNGTQKELAELFLELKRKGYLDKIDHRLVSSAFTNSTTLYQVLKPTTNSKGEETYDGIYTPKYKSKFKDIVPVKN